MRAKRVIPRDLGAEGMGLKKGQSAFQRNGDVMVQVWNDKTCANDAAIVNKGRKDRKPNMGIKKPYAVGQYNKFIKGRPVPQFLHSSEESCKMVEKSGTVFAKLCSIQRIFCVQGGEKK
jgi:hypothetical protein